MVERRGGLCDVGGVPGGCDAGVSSARVSEPSADVGVLGRRVCGFSWAPRCVGLKGAGCKVGLGKDLDQYLLNKEILFLVTWKIL